MRFHTNEDVTVSVLRQAARIARVDMEFTHHASRKTAQAYEIRLTGESRRRPNFYDGSDVFAATWDQWGVFIACLFEADPHMVCGTAYDGVSDFEDKTDERFLGDGWPADAHGDHTFRYSGTPRQQNCTKCSAVQRWHSFS